jgi:hypothetical protein
MHEIAHPPDFTIFGALQLQLSIKQVCIYFKTHFKNLYKSSRIGITHTHFIFFINTTLYLELNTIGTIAFGSTIHEI